MNNYPKNNTTSSHLPNRNQEALMMDIWHKLLDMEEREKRRRIGAWIKTVLIIGLIAVILILALPKIQSLIADYQAISQTVQALTTAADSLNPEDIQKAVDFISGVDYEQLMSLSEVLESLDAADLQNQISQVTSMIDKIGELNLDALVYNVNLISEKLQPLINLLSR